MLPPAPRHYMLSSSLPGAGLPSERLARIAARRAFVTLKAVFLEAVSDLPGATGDWLRHQVRAAETPGDLWMLRAPAYAALAGPEQRARRHALRRGLEMLFPDSELLPAHSGFSPF